MQINAVHLIVSTASFGHLQVGKIAINIKSNNNVHKGRQLDSDLLGCSS